MWERLDRIDWPCLMHAYGDARDVPEMLRGMISADEQERKRCWSSFWGRVNSEGAFFDSTVASVPFLIEALDHSSVPTRVEILDFFCDRWLEAPEHGGDPFEPEPPGGVDEPTPLRLPDQGRPEAGEEPSEEPTDDEAADEECYLTRRMDLCAWQTARVIQDARTTYLRLLDDPDREVAVAAARLLRVWRETRPIAKRALIRAIDEEPDDKRRSERVLDFGVYADEADLEVLAGWIRPAQPLEVRVAAALVWAWVVNPAPVPAAILSALEDGSAPASNVFGCLPWEGVYRLGPWHLPANIASVILRLAASDIPELRLRAVQGLNMQKETARHVPDESTVPVLMRALVDPYNRIAAAAAAALLERSEAVATPANLPALLDALAVREPTAWDDSGENSTPNHQTWVTDGGSSDDDGESISANVARLLAMSAARLDPDTRARAIAGIEAAIRHFAEKAGRVEHFEQQLLLLRNPGAWPIEQFLIPLAETGMQYSMLPPEQCTRMLGEMFDRDPEATLSAVVEIVHRAAVAGFSESPEGIDHRYAVLGALRWLMAIGPVAARALADVDQVAAGDLDVYIRDEAGHAARFIRMAMAVEPDLGTDPAAPADRRRVAALLLDPSPPDSSLIAELGELLQSTDPYVRVGAAEALTKTPHPGAVPPHVVDRLVALLSDDSFIEVGVPGPFTFQGRASRWRRERRSPAASAVKALFALDYIPPGDLILRAMLGAEAGNNAVEHAWRRIPRHFAIEQWRRAATAAGGPAIAEPLVRIHRQSCRLRDETGVHSIFAVDYELAEVIRELSGRLI